MATEQTKHTVADVKNQLDETKPLLMDAVAKVIERGEKTSELVTKTQNLVDHSVSFKKASKKLKAKAEESNEPSVVKSNCCFFSCWDAITDSVQGYFASFRTTRQNAQKEQFQEHAKEIVKKYSLN